MSILDTILNDPDVRNGISKFAADNPDIQWSVGTGVLLDRQR
jgi:hypothetical protein